MPGRPANLQLVKTAPPTTCAGWEGNNSTLGFGHDLASDAAAVAPANPASASVSGHASGQPLPTISFEVIDHFGNLVSGEQTNSGVLW